MKMLSYQEIYTRLGEGKTYYSKISQDKRLMTQKRDRYTNIAAVVNLLLENLRKDGVINLTREDIERKTRIPRRTIEEYLRTLKTRIRISFEFKDGYRMLFREGRNYSRI